MVYWFTTPIKYVVYSRAINRKYSYLLETIRFALSLKTLKKASVYLYALEPNVPSNLTTNMRPF